MKTTKRIEERVSIGYRFGSGNAEENYVTLVADRGEGEGHPKDVHINIDGRTGIFSIEDLLRITEAVKRAGWVPEGHYVCADHGLYDARSSDSAQCSRCEVTR